MNRVKHFVLFYSFLLVFLFVLVACGDSDSDSVSDSDSDSDTRLSLLSLSNQSRTGIEQRKWLTRLFSDAERNFDMDPMVSSQCLRHFASYKTNLQAQTGWAIRMLESSEWPSVGLLSGTTTHLGNWDECLLISVPNMRGKYCLIEGTYGFDKLVKNNSARPAVEWPNDELTVWEILRMFEKNPVRAERKTIQWALCIPSTCSGQDLKISLERIIRPIFENQTLDIRLKIDESSCQVGEESKFSTEFYYAVLFFSLIVILVCLSTLYLIVKKPEKDVRNAHLIASFSLVENFHLLTRYSKKKDFGFVHALKFVSLAIIIYGHRRLYSLGYPNFNPERTEINFKKAINYVELTHLSFVDVFFMLTGFLTFHLDFSAMSKHGMRYWFVAVIHRWMRLIPPFGIIIIFLIFVFPYTSDGPMWNDKVAREIGRCKASWWTNLLAINNIVLTEDQCLVVSWYMSADMQLTAIGLGLLYVMTKHQMLGWIAILSTFTIGAFLTFYVAYTNNFHAVLPVYISFLQNPSGSENFVNFYIASYTRIGPYLVGAMSALITKSLKEKNFKFSTAQKTVGLAVMFVASEVYQHVAFVLEYEFGRSYNGLQHALYAATYRVVFALPWASMLCVYFTTGFGSLEGLFENSFMAVTGRLTYSVFLVNTVIQFLHAASQRSIMANSILMNRFWWVVTDVLFSYLFGVSMFLFFEAPIANLSKLIKRSFLRKSETNNIPAVSNERSPSPGSPKKVPCFLD